MQGTQVQFSACIVGFPSFIGTQSGIPCLYCCLSLFYRYGKRDSVPVLLPSPYLQARKAGGSAYIVPFPPFIGTQSGVPCLYCCLSLFYRYGKRHSVPVLLPSPYLQARKAGGSAYIVPFPSFTGTESGIPCLYLDP